MLCGFYLMDMRKIVKSFKDEYSKRIFIFWKDDFEGSVENSLKRKEIKVESLGEKL